MGFFVCWTPHHTTIMCFDLPQHFQMAFQSTLTSSKDNVELSDPYAVFTVLLYQMISLYDNSVWSIRNHICDWEAVRFSIPTMSYPPLLTEWPQMRQKEPDYPLLHEIARHAIHVGETLTVALQSVKDLQQQHRDFMAVHIQSNNSWQQNHSPLQFPLRLLEGLFSRSESNKARLENETLLVSSN